MTKNRITMMAFLAGLGTMVSAGCATYGAGVSAITTENSAAKVKHEAYGIAGFASGEFSEMSIEMLSGTFEAPRTEDGSSSGTKAAVEAIDVTGGSLGVSFKYPFYLLNDRLTLFPLIGAEYRWFDSEGQDAGRGILFDLKVGGGLDFTFSRSFFLRASVTHTPGVLIGLKGWGFSASLGFRTRDDKVRGRYKTSVEIRAAQLRQRAETAMEEGDWKAAIEAYTQIIAEDPGKAEYYFARAEAYLGAEDYDASVQDFNKGVDLGAYLPPVNGHPAKWRELYRAYREAKGAEAPLMAGRAIVIIPQTSHLRFVQAKTPGLEGAQGSGSEAALKAGRQTVAFRYDGLLGGLTAMTVGDCAMTFDLKEGHVYTAVAGFDGRNFTIRINDVTGKETGLDEEVESSEVTTLTANMFYTDRFKKGMTLSALRRAGFPETWKTEDNQYYVTSIGSGDKRITFGATFGDEGLLGYDLLFFSKYKAEIIDLLSNACSGSFTLDNGNLSWVSSVGIIIGEEYSEDQISVLMLSVVPFRED